MAATPTEVLNDDIEEVRGDTREVSGKIDPVKEEVDRIGVSRAALKTELFEEIRRVALTQPEMKARLTDFQAEIKADLIQEIQRVALARADLKGELRLM